MASGIISTRPQSESAPTQGRYEDFIQKRLEHTRRQVRLVDVASSLMLLTAASLLFFLAVAVLDQWVFQHGLAFLARLGLFLLWVGGVGAFVWRFLLPALVNRINPVFAAQAIEHSRPSLKNSLINFLLLRSHPQDVVPVVYRALEHRAAADLLKVPADHAVDHRRVVHLAYVLAAVVAIFALYLAFSPKNPLVSAARVIWPWSNVPVPTRVHIEEVRPGDDIVYNDDRQEISAQVTGLHEGEEVALLVSTADGQVVDDRIVMTAVDDANHFHCELPPGSGGFQQDTLYRITAGDATTQSYKLEVQVAPTVMIDAIDYHYPAYTGQDDRTIKNQGDIKALEGTQVTIHATANMEIQDARIDLNCEGLQTVSMAPRGMQASGQFKLALDPDNKRAQYNCYQILFTGANGHKVHRPVRYHIDVDPDLKPDIAIVEPRQAEATVAEDGQLQIRVHAFDPDFALRHVALQGERVVHTDREGEKLELPVLLDRPKPEKAWPKPFDRDYTFRPAELKLKAGDLVRYWATAVDNKEPRPNISDTRETVQHTIRIVPAGQGPQQTSREPQQPSQDNPQQQPGGGKSEKGRDETKSEKGQGGDSSNKGDSSQKGDQAGGEKSPDKGQDANKPNDSKPGDSKEPGQPENNGSSGKRKASPDSSNNPKGGDKSSDPNSGEPGDQSHQPVDSTAQRSDAIQEILKDKQKQDADQPKDQKNQPDQSSGDQKQEPKQDPGQQSDQQQGGNPQQSGDQGSQGGKQPQGKSGDKNDQGGAGKQEPQGGSQQPQAGKQDSGPQKGGQQGSGDKQIPSGQGDQKTSSQQGNSSGSPNAGSQPQGDKQSGKQSAENPSSPDGGKGNEPKSSGDPKANQNAGGQPKSASKSSGGEKSPQGQSADGSKSEKPQPGGEQGKDPSAQGGNPPASPNKQPGSQGSGDEKQLAQNGAKPEQQKPGSSNGSDSQGTPGGQKPGEKPKEASSNSQSGSQGSQPKKDEKQDGGGQSGGDKPKQGQGDQSGSNAGGNKPNGSKPGGNKGGTADGDHAGQKDPGKTGEPTSQDSTGAPDSQMDREKGDPKNGDARQGLNEKSDQSQSPGNSPHDSNSSSDTQGDRKGGGGAGGGEADKKAGKGAEGTQKPADSGGSASNERGPGATGKKAGEDVQSTDRTGSSHKEPGKGNGEKQDASNEQTAKDDSQNPKGDRTPDSAGGKNTASGGKEGSQSSKQPGHQGAGLPAGGSQAGDTGNPPPQTPPPDSGPDPANLEFSKKQVDLALEHLKDQMAKQKPELLDRLGWSKEEGQRFLDNLKKLRDSAQQPGNEGEAGKKAYNEFLKNLDLHPHGTEIGGGHTKTDDVRNVHDSGQMEPPGDWADQYHAFTHGTAGK